MEMYKCITKKKNMQVNGILPLSTIMCTLDAAITLHLNKKQSFYPD